MPAESERHQPATQSDLASLRELIIERFNTLDLLEKQREVYVEATRVQMEKRLDEHNSDRIRFVTKVEYEAAHSGLNNRVSSLERLVYIGAGAALIVNALLVYFLTKH